MENLKVMVVEEILLDNGQIGRRQSEMEIDPVEGFFIRPDHKMNETGIAEWERILDVLHNADGGCLMHILNGPALLDHCLDVQAGRTHRKKGCGGREEHAH